MRAISGSSYTVPSVWPALFGLPMSAVAPRLRYQEPSVAQPNREEQMKQLMATTMVLLMAAVPAFAQVDDNAQTKRGAVVGGALGAVLGAIVGNNTGHRSGGRGLVVGGAAGAAAG